MRKFFILLIILSLLTRNNAKCDNIIIKGDTLGTVFFSPFDNYPDIVKLREKLKDYRTNCTEDNCMFFSTWSIVNNRLVLAKIENCKCNEKKQTANLKALFGNRLLKGMLCADWYSGEIWVTKDRPNSWGGMFAASWPSETRLIVKEGVIISIKDFVYPQPVETVYHTNTSMQNEFIYTHINWSKFHKLPEHSKRFYFSFDQDENGYLINLKQYANNGSDERFDQDEMEEITRVAALIQWPLYFYHGKPAKSFTGLEIVLSKELQQKFATHINNVLNLKISNPSYR